MTLGLSLRSLVTKIKTLLGGSELHRVLIGTNDPEDFGGGVQIGDPYDSMPWTHIAVAKLVAQFTRVDYKHYINGKEITSGPVYELFRYVNADMNLLELWKQTAGWWWTEGEAFWWFGPNYTMGLPKELYILDPRYVYQYVNNGRVIKWVYRDPENGLDIPILPDEIIHFRAWNRTNKYRGLSPFFTLAQELLQTYSAGKENTENLLDHAIPAGLIKTDRDLGPEQIKVIERTWKAKYGRNHGKGNIAVIPNGGQFQEINTDLMKYMDLLKNNRETILAMFGVPPRVVGLGAEGTPLSGSDTDQEYQSLWLHTIIPVMNGFISLLLTQFYDRFKRLEKPKFDTDALPEFSKARLEKAETYIKQVQAGLMTQNEANRRLGNPEVPWGNTWYKQFGLIPVDTVPTATPPTKAVTPSVNVEGLYTKPTEGKSLDHLYKTKATPSPYTPEVKRELTEAYLKGIIERELRFQKAIKDFFYEQRKKILDLLFGNIENSIKKDSMSVTEIEAKLKSITVDGIISMLSGQAQKGIDSIIYLDWEEEGRILSELSGDYLLDASEYGAETMGGLLEPFGVKINWDIINPRILEEVQNRAKLITRIVETDRDKIRDILEEVLSEGLTTNDAADKIRDYYKGMTQWRSETIARTELNAAANDARAFTMEYSGVGYHEWGHGYVENERPDHRATDGVVVMLGDLFQPANLKRPYDPDGTAEQVINCHCSTFPRPDVTSLEEGV